MTSTGDPLDIEMQRIERNFRSTRPFMEWLRQPRSKWLRLPAGVALVAGGTLGFLPILGFWMVPLGLVVVAQDVKPLRPPLARGLGWALDKWEKRKR
jgi:hypothetical protein